MQAVPYIRASGAAGAIVTALALVIGCGSAPPPSADSGQPVRVAVVPDPAQVLRAPLLGTAQAIDEIDLGFEVTGQMAERPIKMGDRVRQGQMLAQLDLRDFEAAVDRAKAARERAKVRLGRVRQAAKSGAVSQQDVTEAEAHYEEAEAEVGIKTKALEDATLRAPFAGVVAATYVDNFQEVRAREPILRLLDISRIEMWVQVAESSIALIPYVEVVTVRFDALPGKEFPARIYEVGTEADDQTGAFPVSLLIEQADGHSILPGMAGQAGVRLKPGSGPGVGPVVPLSAIFSDATGGTHAWVIDDASGAVTQREVKTDRLTNTGILVREGLEPGEKIVVEGGQFLHEGRKVRALTAEARAT
jgi:RND family efflux transporter MFP subunit